MQVHFNLVAFDTPAVSRPPLTVRAGLYSVLNDFLQKYAAWPDKGHCHTGRHFGEKR